MKKINKILALAITVAATASCNYLDVVPDNVATIDYAFRNKEVAENYLFGCYSYRTQIGDVRNDPAMSGSDEIWQYYITREWDRFITFTGSRIRRGEQNVTSPIYNNWDGRLFVGIRDCNIFLENIHKVRDVEAFQRDRWIAEAKFLKAYYHYLLMKQYGPIPIVDVNLPSSAGVDEVQVYREDIDTVVKYITDLMYECVEDLPPATETVGTEYGRVDQCVALSVRAEVLLFAASPLFNGNTDYAKMIDNRGVQLFPQTYDPEKWVTAKDAVLEAIEACHAQDKRLWTQVDPIVASQNEIFQIQTTYRQVIAERWNTELIWGSWNTDWGFRSRASATRIVTAAQPGVQNDNTGEYSPDLNMVDSYYSSNGVPISEDQDWVNNGWYSNRNKIRPEPSSGDEIYYVKEGQQTVYLHYNREPRFYASIGFDKGIYYGSGYNVFSGDGANIKYCNFFNTGWSGMIGGDAYSGTGYSNKKMHSFRDTQTNDASSHLSYPFPVLRLADLYLMYAEALNESLASPSEDVYYYVDQVRARVGLKGVRESWQNHSINPTKPDTKEGMRAIIKAERRIELAFEAKRFWDIRRWKDIEVMNEVARGWNIMAETAEDFYKVLVLPKESVRFTTKDYFWPIMETDLYVNRNLVQNYGW